MQNTERVISNVGNSTGEKSKVEGVMASFSMQQIGAEEVKCSRITKSFYQRTPSETILQANQTSNLLVSTRRQDKPDGVECEPAKYSVQLFSNQTSIFHSSGFNQKLDESTGKRKGRKDGTTAGVEDEFTFTAVQGVLKSDKTKPEDKSYKTEKRTENLKMKLWEILATTSSPKTRPLGSQTCNMDEESVLPEQRFEQEDDKFVKTRQNSDTIETDSENPNLANKRPVTRSCSRKRASAQMQRTKNKSGQSSRDKKGPQGKDSFCPKEKWTGRKNVFADGGFSTFLSKKSLRQNSRKICFNETDTVDKLCPEASKTEIQPCDGKTFSLGKKMGGFLDCLPDHHKEYSPTQKIIQEKELNQSPTINKTDKHGGLEGSANANQQNDKSNPVTEDDVAIAEPLDNFQSPTFGLRTPTLSPSPGSTPKKDVNVNEVSSPTSMEGIFSLGIIRNLRTLQTLEPKFNMRFLIKLQDMNKVENSLPRKAASFLKEKDAVAGLSDSSSEERKSQGSQEGAGESDWFHETSELTQDGFVRAVELFCLELGKLKSKIKSVASKKSSEILMSVAEEIHLQLENVHSQIQEDIGKLTSLSESKRKRLETRFEDQQKQLRLIQEKFKEEINLHIQDCRSAIEGLEAERIEIKGALEKRRASQRKLLSQVEEGVEIQLNDAQRKITLSRRKLLQLKHVIAACLKDGILN
ncbi:meiosis-specific protein ASY3 [Senna tora]|uniref:Meiosis-specific protein ASY3 n=1 Tax=Senna tora TaxID=362788 RepID=A0A834T9P8_9FABA|nr:meiosis-specific protein ASY3 [Senna tora]